METATQQRNDKHWKPHIRLSDRERRFERAYNLCFILMKAAALNLELAAEHCDPGHRALRHSLSLAARAQEVRITDISLKLRPEYWRALQDDLSSEPLQAICNVLSEYATCDNALALEDDLLEWIRARKLPLPKES